MPDEDYHLSRQLINSVDYISSGFSFYFQLSSQSRLMLFWAAVMGWECKNILTEMKETHLKFSYNHQYEFGKI